VSKGAIELGQHRNKVLLSSLKIPVMRQGLASQILSAEHGEPVLSMRLRTNGQWIFRSM
jgi:hypothetical protein